MPTRISSGNCSLTPSIWAAIFSIGVRSLISPRVEVDAVDVPVLVAVLVLRVEDVLARVGPEVAHDAAVLVVRHRLGLRRIVVRADPHVQHALDRRDKRQPLAIRAEPRPGLFRIAEERLPRNQRHIRRAGGGRDGRHQETHQ